MKKLILLILLFPAFVWAQGITLPNNMSVVVMQAKDGKVLFSEQASTPKTPASTTKLLTSYVALKTLGPDFTFKTQVLQDGNTLYIRFGGDPSLKSSDLLNLISRALNSQEIKGNVVIDHSVFSAPWVARGWIVDDIPWSYAAPVHGVIIDGNQIPLTLYPPKQLGEAVKITSKNPNINVISNVKAVDTATSETLCQLDVNLPRFYQIEFEGCWPVSTAPQTLKVANQFPVETAMNILQKQFGGTFSTGITPSNAQLLAEHQSPPLSELIKEVLQNSNNMYTDAITKTLGGKIYQRPTFQAGSYFIEKSLKQQLSLPHSGLILFDGSGLSTQNLISANTLAQLLRLIYQDKILKPYFIETLSASGIKGTLKNRLQTLTSPFVGKTGSITHVSTLAGYHGLETDNPLIYVIMINNDPQKSHQLKKQEDSVLRLLIKLANTSPAVTL